MYFQIKKRKRKTLRKHLKIYWSNWNNFKGIGTLISKVSNDDNDDDVIFDWDDLQTYGPAQYSEREILLLNNEPERTYLRNLVIGNIASTSGTATKLSKPNASSTPSQSAVTAPKEENNQNIANNICSLRLKANFL